MTFIEYLDEHYDYHGGKGGGQIKLIGECPFCHEDRYDLRLYINPDTGLGFCHHCDTKFGPYKFVAAHAGVSMGKAKKMLSAASEGFVRGKEETAEPSAVWWPAFEKISGPAMDYLAGRGFGQTLVNHFNLKFIPTNTVHDGRVRYTANRILIPIFDRDGNSVAWQGRDITGQLKAKYTFPNGYKSAEYVYNINAIPADPDYLIVCEGVFDVWGWWRAGFVNAVATFGKKMSRVQVEQIASLNPKVVFLAWDSDAHIQKYEFAEKYGHLFKVLLTDLGGYDADELDRGPLLSAIKGSTAYSWEDKILGSLA